MADFTGTIASFERKYREANARAIVAVVAGDDNALAQARGDMRMFRKFIARLEDLERENA